MYNISKIAYVTDLHLGSAPTRLPSFTGKLAALRDMGITRIINGGDMFDLRGDMWKPRGLVDSRVPSDQMLEMSDYSRRITSDLMRTVTEHICKNGLYFSIFGNADYLSAPEMNRFKESQPLKAFHRFQVPLAQPYNGLVSWALREEGRSNLFISGLSGIPALSCDAGARNVNANNPWYMGVVSSERYNELVSKLGIPGRENIVVTHMPAKGVMDSFYHKGMDRYFEDQGSEVLRNSVTELGPILHLTGHVHGAPTVVGDYRPFVVNYGKTVTINPGGGDLHDEDICGIKGVKIAVIDPYTLINMRNDGVLTEDNIKDAKAVEII